MPIISPHAIVESSAELAADVQVGPFCYIGPKVRIYRGCVIENNVTIVGRTVLGENCHVFPMSLIGAPAGDEPVVAQFAARPTDGETIIGPSNSIREHVTIYAGLLQPTRLGSDNLIMIDCHVGEGATIGNHCIFANCTHLDRGAIIEDYIRTSGFAVVAPGVRVGAYTFIAGFTGIDRDSPPFAMVQGHPYRVRGVNTHNLKRCGFGDDDIQSLKDAFREIFNGNDEGYDEKVVHRLAAKTDLNPHVRRVIEALTKPSAGRR